MLEALLLFALAQAAVDGGPPEPESCGDLDSFAASAQQGKDCAALEQVRLCLSARLSEPAPAAPFEQLQANGSIVTNQDIDAGVGPGMPIDAVNCAAYAAQPAVGGFWRDTLLAECVRVVGAENVLYNESRRTSELLARATRLTTTCDAAASRAEGAAAKAKEAADTAAQNAFVKAHPEVPREAISAVICRTGDYRKWARGQIQLAEKVGGVDNLVAAEQLRRLALFLEAKIADAEKTLSYKFGVERLSCSREPVRSLAKCAETPMPLDHNGHAYVEDPEQACAPPDEHFDWYRPHAGWYLGTAWFQPTGQ